jgi:3-oxoacyl-[acyl-carrier protein] reductase
MTAQMGGGRRPDLASSIPLQRIGTPDEIALAVDYLMGPGGAYVTGQTLSSMAGSPSEANRARGPPLMDPNTRQ